MARVLPQTFRVRQRFEAPMVADVAGETDARLARLGLDREVAPGQRVAIAVGSRGIANLATIVRAVVDHVRRLGGEPVIVPAMGSHGGATAEGQASVLAGFGVTDAAMGCPVRSCMETVIVADVALGDEGERSGEAAASFPVHVDRTAYEADHIILVNRVKPHTRFVGPIESGLMKMLLIGLGKAEGAAVYHRLIRRWSFERIIHAATATVLERCPVLAGVAVVENARDQTARIDALRPGQFITAEPELLELARRWMARLPMDEVDVLVIDQIGKDISGTGMDTNVVGRKFDDHKATGDERPRVEVIALRGLSAATHGNANGMGMAEFCRSDLFDQVDVEATRLNAVTAQHASAAMPPLDYPTDRDMLEMALQAAVGDAWQSARLLWIRDTLHLEELECSAAYLDEARRCDDLDVLTDPRPLPLDGAGNLPASVAVVSNSPGKPGR